MTRRSFAALLVGVFLAGFLAAAAGIGVRTARSAHVAVDEPQYLLTAQSLGQDGDLDITDDLRDGWRPYADVPPPVQTQVRADGSQVSPHDPLLPLVLALPMTWGGWVAAKLVLAFTAGLAAALTCWIAVRRFAVSSTLAAVGTAAAFASAPLAVYGQQVYPEMPAALAVLVAVAALTGPLRRGGMLALALAVVSLPWLGVKYAPVAGVLAVTGLYLLARRGDRRSVGALLGALAAAGVAYLAVHQAIWGGWTVYASGDHFVTTGEFAVMGVDPDYLDRGVRLVGLFVDREFGLVPWQPAWLLALPALGWLLVARPQGWAALVPSLIAGWLTAVFIALTMHGFWWPGRQVVVVLPLALLVVLAWLDSARGARWRPVAAALGAVGLATYAALLAAGYARSVTWVTGFGSLDWPGYALLRPLLPDYRHDRGVSLWLRHDMWAVVLLALLAAGAVSAASTRQRSRRGVPPATPSAASPVRSDPLERITLP